MINHLFAHSFSDRELDKKSIKIKEVSLEEFTCLLADQMVIHGVSMDNVLPSDILMFTKKIVGRGAKAIWFDADSQKLKIKYGKYAKHRSRKTN